MSENGTSSALSRSHRRTAVWCGAVVVAMVGASYAAVPLYRMFCNATGFDGTPRIASKPADKVLDRVINVRFDANVGPGMPWRFEPVEGKVDVKLGETTLAFYRATNTSDHTITGSATFNVFPEQSAPFFNKLECFCFQEQTLAPGQSIEMPVSFFVDPAIVNDKDARGTTHITLSYTFYPVAPKPSVAEKRDGKTG
ncbi:MAG: cytochrome c oxidase assembly protein [Hyphomicrobiales bacterium]|nr:MAG: cytochrome c oxidase assembly protein [Hyphomicrobiales bacterium]